MCNEPYTTRLRLQGRGLLGEFNSRYMLCTECLIIIKPTIRNTCKRSNLYADKILCVAVFHIYWPAILKHVLRECRV